MRSSFAKPSPLLLLIIWLGINLPAEAFSALAHLAVVDSCWTRGLVPALQARYPGATAAQLDEARSYAYGGALLQDLGYFPGNASLFSDLTHYVRSGEFVEALLADARDRNELAFALGALSHYAADASGHPAGTNAVTGLVFPELPAAPGTALTYAQAPAQHTQVEFAFDVAELQAGHYRSEEFHARIGLRVCRALLERSFRRTYGLPLGRVLPHVPEGLAAFRLVATQLLPAAVRASQYVPQARVRQLPLAEQLAYYRRLNSARFCRAGRRADHLSLQMRLLVWLVPTLPRLGVARLLAFRPLPAAAVATMRAGFATALGSYSALLGHVGEPLADLNLDTGQPSRPADYPLADRTAAAWAARLAQARLPLPPPPLAATLADGASQ
ncbi:zinc dependent phospholipase C family protein [Hymenobacter sp. BRD128]|uniref:zinc dependent phospholipase C family protein n=1 Tax=Hymenobacter sp. BRD128 TaxID=2675878 RepID=UPI0015650A23|nr:zinc dependent phospholipase C family protein [Hymenobacter sp. BRD128]QKG58068.1 zinc dependent phospholipase C family protein [Hymenobacter sp. BRD128]